MTVFYLVILQNKFDGDNLVGNLVTLTKCLEIYKKFQVNIRFSLIPL